MNTSKNFCVIKHHDTRSGEADTKNQAEHTIESFLQLDTNFLRQSNLTSVYIHFNDFYKKSQFQLELWLKVLEVCQEAAIKVFYFTRSSFHWKNILETNQSIPVFDWVVINKYLGQVNHLSHHAPFIPILYISSFSVLAQGYLISQCYLQKESLDNNDIYKIDTYDVVNVALKQMGWDTFKTSSNYAEIIHTDLSKKNEETKKRCWWLEPFDIDCKQPQAEIHRQIDQVYEQIKKEWNVPKYGEVTNCVNKLIEVLKTSTSIEDSTIVANAYLAISKRLAHE